MELIGLILVTVAGAAMALTWMLLGMGLALIVGAMLLAPLGFLAWRDDQKIDKRDRDIAVFLRGLGSVMGASSTTVAEGLNRMNRKALGAMEVHVHRLLRAPEQRHLARADLVAAVQARAARNW